jgi:hypothetical protein
MLLLFYNTAFCKCQPHWASNSKFNKFVQQIPLRDAQRYASAGPGSIKGQAFGLAFYAATRAHSAVVRAMALHSTCGAVSKKLEGFKTIALVVQPSYFNGNVYLLSISAAAGWGWE